MTYKATPLLAAAAAGTLIAGSAGADIIFSLTSGDSPYLTENNATFVNSATAGWIAFPDGTTLSDDTGTSGLVMTISSGDAGFSATSQGADTVGAGTTEGGNGFLVGNTIVVTFNQDVSLDSLFFGHGGTTARTGGEVTPTVGATALSTQEIFPIQDVGAGGWFAEVVYDDTTVLTAGDSLSITLTTGASSALGLNAIEVSVIPEPGSLALIGLGGLLVSRRRR